MKHKISAVIFGLFFLIGLSIMLYPTVSNLINRQNQSKAIGAYEKAVDKLDDDVFQTEWKEAEAYNDYLEKYTTFNYAAEGEKTRSGSPYESLLNVAENGIMGVIDIPTVNISLPIYHGTSDEVLQAGAGHYIGSSLPVGGEGTHTVLTGHRGLPSAKLFTDIDRLRKGDVFYVRTLGKTLAYQVDQIQTTLPDEVRLLEREEGKDYVTLVTCTPYGVNTHRLLIRGVRIPYQEEAGDVFVPSDARMLDPMLIAPILALPMILIVGLCLVLTYIIRRRGERI